MNTFEKMKQEVTQAQAEALSRGDFRELYDFVCWAFRDLTPEEWESEYEDLVEQGYIEDEDDEEDQDDEEDGPAKKGERA